VASISPDTDSLFKLRSPMRFGQTVEELAMLDSEQRTGSCDPEALMIDEEYELGDWLDDCKGAPVEAAIRCANPLEARQMR
jgi:hypothetical protein